VCYNETNVCVCVCVYVCVCVCENTILLTDRFLKITLLEVGKHTLFCICLLDLINKFIINRTLASSGDIRVFLTHFRRVMLVYEPHIGELNGYAFRTEFLVTYFIALFSVCLI
jgi:hypothetical protein